MILASCESHFVLHLSTALRASFLLASLWGLSSWLLCFVYIYCNPVIYSFDSGTERFCFLTNYILDFTHFSHNYFSNFTKFSDKMIRCMVDIFSGAKFQQLSSSKVWPSTPFRIYLYLRHHFIYHQRLLRSKCKIDNVFSWQAHFLKLLHGLIVFNYSNWLIILF